MRTRTSSGILIMPLGLWVAVIFCAHVAFLFGAYGTHFFGVHVPYPVALVLWLGVSSVIAALAYYLAFARAAVGAGYVQVGSAVGATVLSLFVGVFLAFNIYGT